VGIFKEDKGDFLIPRGNHRIEEEDTIFLVTKSQFIKEATDLLTALK
jgi:Trk K+ transport system NAD-binding subunit